MSHKILLVEDNPDILFNIKMMLEFNDFSVIEAKNGKEALKILENIDYTPDLVLSDIMMPEMDGWVFYKTLKLVCLGIKPFVAAVYFHFGPFRSERSEAWTGDRSRRLYYQAVY